MSDKLAVVVAGVAVGREQRHNHDNVDECEHGRDEAWAEKLEKCLGM